ncbi:TPA: hypothetical protein N0F65_010081 [Lagenidium giganteum]|uniref:PH domain-containing protein n=1 Tax=Lagenidium giganteum TaxID=4803 RepID=A0AAV2ZF22_9STRA|nr:TPA: hypothetical protein N0F65_010081 [Lagenidium giganteum]
MGDISDEFIWSLDTFIKDDSRRPSTTNKADDDIARVSFLSQDDLVGDNLVFEPGDDDLIYGMDEAPRDTFRVSRLSMPMAHSARDEALSATDLQYSMMRKSSAAAVPPKWTSEAAPPEDTGDAATRPAPRWSSVMGDDVEEAEEQKDMVSHLDSTHADHLNSINSEVFLKSSQRSQSDGTDRSFSFASEDNDSPLNSPRAILRRLSDSAQSTYEQRIEASLQENLTKSLNLEFFHKTETAAHRQFTMDDLAHFDSQFGREAFLEELGRSFIDGSGAKSLASYSMSTFSRNSSSASSKTDVIKQGWMIKRGEVVPSWHRRWFSLRRTPGGPMLTYSKDNTEHSPTKIIELSSTSRCIVAPSGGRGSKEHEFRIVTSADSARREYSIAAQSNFDMTEWVCAIQASITAGNKSTFEGSSDFQRIWNEIGIQGFLLRYGVRKCSARNHLQTRVLELNFAEQTITNSRRGETLTTLHFGDLLNVSLTSNRVNGEEYGLVLNFNGRHRSWPIYLDTKDARDDLYSLLRKIAKKEVTGADLEARCPRLLLKKGFLERKNIAADLRIVGPHATLKGRLFVCLHENCIVFFPEFADMSARPWYLVALKGLNVSCKEEKSMLILGRLVMVCASPEDCRAWYNAIVAATSLPVEVAEVELQERVKIRNSFHSSVLRLRRLLKANVKPEVNGPPKDHKTIELMMRKLWSLTFPGEEYTSNSDSRWQEIGFQRGGPASDLRSSGLLGLYCLIYFVTYPSGEFQRILDRTRFGVSEGNMKNYPLAIACINVVAILTETLGFGDAGSHSEGCSLNAMKTYVYLIAKTVDKRKDDDESERLSTTSRSLDSYETWEEIVAEPENHVFEDMFCLLFPTLDALFVEMGAGYMEFGQVVVSFRRRLSVIFDALPRSMEELRSKLLWALAVVVAALGVQFWNDFGPLDRLFPDYSNHQIEQHYSDSYATARALFRARARAANAELHALPLSLPDLDLTVDVAVLRGSKENVLLHLSGTHGVEGFAGSAIQSALLKEYATRKPAATVVFVHAVNPYGFAMLRRFNERNVDLNRNFLTPAEFKERAAMDPNHFGYMDVSDILNPKDITGSFWLRAARLLMTHSFATVKRGIVSGNYHFPKTVYYGGAEQEESLVLIQQFLRQHLDLAAVKRVTVVDVHTGLGAPGQDTLMIGPSTSSQDDAKATYSSSVSAKRLALIGDSSNGVSEGYDGATGFVVDGFARMFGDDATKRLAVVQEFGTTPGVFVLKATMEENVMFQRGHGGARLPYASKLRDVFYLHRSASWKRSVVERGQAVAQETLDKLQVA